jgi:hypothetical protein
MATPRQPTQPAGKSLFSLHYLATRLPDLPEWQEDAAPTFAALHALWQKAQQLGTNWNEAQTEDEFVKPVLELLGWSYIPQVKNRSRGRVNRPDYALFADETTKDAAYPHQGDDDAFYGRALAIAEAKYWGRPLSQKDASGRDAWKSDNNPSHQMVSYLVGTRCTWGILTNGKQWRLYSREVSSTASEYYEVDLGAVFGSSEIGEMGGEIQGEIGEIDAFKRWWLFFRRAAFTPDSGGRSFVQRVHEGSATYAREVSDKLKELVFREVMPEIAGGFVAYRHRELGIERESEESLRQLYGASLSLLYKLLFVLYAEARSLLPVANPAYWEESLTRMAQQFAARIDRGLPYSDATHATRQYDALVALFRRIDQGDASLGVPRYDGGLFNAASPDNQFLAQHKLSDRAVAHAVDILVRDAGQPVDYAYISVRNLGSIYEGLLENKLHVVDAAAGQVELVNDKGERKATGSYYTPDYIVDYIVEQTLAPILAERQGRFVAAMEQVAELRRQLQHADGAGRVALLRPQLAAAEREARESFLGIKVCDPAMGSGHFLVNAVDYITDGVIEQMQRYHDEHPAVPWAWNPIQTLIDRVRQDILEEMERQGLAVEPRREAGAQRARLDDTALLTRLVMKRCIYGVDLNPMAVELAKLSLWLHSFTVGAPLSFLDHHLRWGNSLIGSDVRTVEETLVTTRQTQSISKAARQLAEARGEQARQQAVSYQANLFGGPFAGLLDLTAIMIEIAGQADSTLADVRQSAEHYRTFQANLLPYKQALDLWVSQHFGNTAALDFLETYPTDVLPALRGERKLSKAHGAAIDQARTLWQEKRFFHWDLEFPEVFIDLERRDWAENPGFDAVIGNPPYVRQEQLTPNKPWLRASFAVYHGVTDLYAYFYERGVLLLREGGLLGLITSNKFIRSGYGVALRGFLAAEAQLRTLIDFGHAPIFEDADTFPCILVLQRMPADVVDSETEAEICAFPRAKLGQTDLPTYVRQHGFTVSTGRFGSQPWSLERPAVEELISKLRRIGMPLSEFIGARPVYGIKTGFNAAFLIDTVTKARLIQEDPTCAPLIKPYLRGQDIKRWTPEWSGLWMILLKSSENQPWPWSGVGENAETVFAESYPALYRHFKPHEQALRKRQDQGRFWWELRSCTYYALFEHSKIIHTDITWRPQFALSDEPVILLNTAYMWPTNDLYLLAIVNSPLIWAYMWRNATHGKDEALRLIYTFVETIPIAPATDAIRSEVEPAVQRLIALTTAQREITSSVLDWLKVEFDIETPGQRLAELSSLEGDSFIREVGQRRPRAAGRLTPASVQALRGVYDDHIPTLRSHQSEARKLEHRLADLVNQAYQLTPAEVDLLWQTAPPRMPITR